MQNGPKVRHEPLKPPASSPPEKPADTSEDTSGGATGRLSEEKLRASFDDDEDSGVQDGPSEFSTEAKATTEEDPFEGDDLDGFRDSVEPRDY